MIHNAQPTTNKPHPIFLFHKSIISLSIPKIWVLILLTVYNFYDVSWENMALDQLMIPYFILFFILMA